MKLLELVPHKAAKAKEKQPPKDLFSTGSASEITDWLKKEYKDKKAALDAAHSHMGSGKALSHTQKSKIERIKLLLDEE